MCSPAAHSNSWIVFNNGVINKDSCECVHWFSPKSLDYVMGSHQLACLMFVLYLHWPMLYILVRQKNALRVLLTSLSNILFKFWKQLAFLAALLLIQNNCSCTKRYVLTQKCGPFHVSKNQIVNRSFQISISLPTSDS